MSADLNVNISSPEIETNDNRGLDQSETKATTSDTTVDCNVNGNGAKESHDDVVDRHVNADDSAADQVGELKDGEVEFDSKTKIINDDPIKKEENLQAVQKGREEMLAETPEDGDNQNVEGNRKDLVNHDELSNAVAEVQESPDTELEVTESVVPNQSSNEVEKDEVEKQSDSAVDVTHNKDSQAVVVNEIDNHLDLDQENGPVGPINDENVAESKSNHSRNDEEKIEEESKLDSKDSQAAVVNSVHNKEKELVGSEPNQFRNDEDKFEEESKLDSEDPQAVAINFVHKSLDLVREKQQSEMMNDDVTESEPNQSSNDGGKHEEERKLDSSIDVEEKEDSQAVVTNGVQNDVTESEPNQSKNDGGTHEEESKSDSSINVEKEDSQAVVISGVHKNLDLDQEKEPSKLINDVSLEDLQEASKFSFEQNLETAPYPTEANEKPEVESAGVPASDENRDGVPAGNSQDSSAATQVTDELVGDNQTMLENSSRNVELMTTSDVENGKNFPNGSDNGTVGETANHIPMDVTQSEVLAADDHNIHEKGSLLTSQESAPDTVLVNELVDASQTTTEQNQRSEITTKMSTPVVHEDSPAENCGSFPAAPIDDDVPVEHAVRIDDSCPMENTKLLDSVKTEKQIGNINANDNESADSHSLDIKVETDIENGPVVYSNAQIYPANDATPDTQIGSHSTESVSGGDVGVESEVLEGLAEGTNRTSVSVDNPCGETSAHSPLENENCLPKPDSKAESEVENASMAPCEEVPKEGGFVSENEVLNDSVVAIESEGDQVINRAGEETTEPCAELAKGEGVVSEHEVLNASVVAIESEVDQVINRAGDEKIEPCAELAKGEGVVPEHEVLNASVVAIESEADQVINRAGDEKTEPCAELAKVEGVVSEHEALNDSVVANESEADQVINRAGDETTEPCAELAKGEGVVSEHEVLNDSVVAIESDVDQVINRAGEEKTETCAELANGDGVLSESEVLDDSVVANESEGDQVINRAGDEKTGQEAECVDGVCRDETPIPTKEGSAVDASDEQNLSAEAGKGPFYIIKVPRYDEKKLREEIDLTEFQVESKTKSRDAIRTQMHTRKANRNEYRDRFEAARLEERAARDLHKAKRKEIDSVQSVINITRSALDVEEIDHRIRNMEHMIQHETLALKEEKQLIREINQLKQTREQLSSNMGSQDKVQQAMDQKDQTEERLKSLKKEADALRDNLLKAEAVTRDAKKKYNDENDKVNELQAEFRAADNIRQEAYAHLQSLRKQLYEKNKYFYKYKDDSKLAYNLASKGDKEELQGHCANQVERVMELWKNDEFRREYVRCNLRSTLRRLHALDGRELGPDEQPPIIPDVAIQRVPKDDIAPSTPALEVEKPVAPVETEKRDDKSTAKPGDQKKQTSKTKKPEKPASLENGLPTVSGREQIEDSTQEEHKMTKEEEELARKAGELRKEEAAARLKEQQKLEEKAKAKEAMERKKRIADKAQARAALRAQKEAEQKEKEKEKKARKKEKKKAAAEDTTDINDVAPSSETPNENKESERTEKPTTVTKRHQKPSPYVRQTKAKSMPLPLRNKGRRMMQTWMWISLILLVVIAFSLMGNSSILNFGLKWSGV